MENDKVGVFDAVTSQYAIWRGVLTRAAALFEHLTFRIPQGSSAETIVQLSQRWRLSEEQRQYLVGLCSEKVGATFFADKIEEMNRAALHRSAFALNAVTHLLFVDLGAQLYLSLPQIKWFFVLANLCVAWIAHASIRQELQALLAGPNALPPKRRMGGLLPNPDYNRAVKQSSPSPRPQRVEREIIVSAGLFYQRGDHISGLAIHYCAGKGHFPLRPDPAQDYGTILHSRDVVRRLAWR